VKVLCLEIPGIEEGGEEEGKTDLPDKAEHGEENIVAKGMPKDGIPDHVDVVLQAYGSFLLPPRPLKGTVI
jgi:hypothetical protein